jgi:hypothetical protein
MIKRSAAIALFAIVAVELFARAGFASPDDAGLRKSDRLLARVAVPDCSTQRWPNFSADCLHGSAEIVAVRMIHVRG